MTKVSITILLSLIMLDQLPSIIVNIIWIKSVPVNYQSPHLILEGFLSNRIHYISSSALKKNPKLIILTMGVRI